MTELDFDFQLRTRLVYGEGSDTLESVVGELLRQKDSRVAIAESCTAGMISSRLAEGLPNRILAKMVSLNKKVSWVTKAILFLRE